LPSQPLALGASADQFMNIGPLTPGGLPERAPWLVRLRTLGGDTEVPDKAEELSARHNDDLLFRFAFRLELRMARTPAVLGFPGHRFDVPSRCPPSLQQSGPEPGAVPPPPDELAAK
jgi:hypothetical protein